jgi:hypothetical protein
MLVLPCLISLLTNLLCTTQVYWCCPLTCTLTVPWLKWLVASLSPWRLGLAHTVQFTWDMWWIYRHKNGSKFFGFPVNIIALWLSIHITWGMKNTPIGGCSSETKPLDMNKNNHVFLQITSFTQCFITEITGLWLFPLCKCWSFITLTLSMNDLLHTSKAYGFSPLFAHVQVSAATVHFT